MWRLPGSAVSPKNRVPSGAIVGVTTCEIVAKKRTDTCARWENSRNLLEALKFERPFRILCTAVHSLAALSTYVYVLASLGKHQAILSQDKRRDRSVQMQY